MNCLEHFDGSDWESVQKVARYLQEWIIDGHMDVADISNFAHELGCMGFMATCSPIDESC